MCKVEEGLIVKQCNCIDDIERRFKTVTEINADLFVFPIIDGSIYQKTSKKDIDKYGFVTTPLDIVDQMVLSMIEKTAGCSYEELLHGKSLSERRKLLIDNDMYIDLCCGCGQFAIRLLRALYNLSIDKRGKQDTDTLQTTRFMYNNLVLAELNPESIAKVIYVFGGIVNLMMGDSSNVNLNRNQNGLLFWRNGVWQRNDEFTANVCSILQPETTWKSKVRMIEAEVRKNMDENGNFIEQSELPFDEPQE